MILFLTTSSLVKSGTIRAIITSALQKDGVRCQVMFNDLHIKTPEIDAGKYANGRLKMPPKHAIEKARKNLDNDIAILNPKLIVINDENTLQIITGEKYTLATVRGSLYYYRNIPCIVLDSFSSIKYRKTAKFAFELDLAKIARWATGKQKNEPAFNYVLCKTVEEVRLHCEAAKQSLLVATDTETAGGFITCVTYSYLDAQGKVVSFEVPFFDPFNENGAYWKTEAEEKQVRYALRDLNASSVIKVLANGTYDCAYFIMEGMPLVNYLGDTQNMMHSIWIEASKALDKIASYFIDHYTYWKDEAKGIKEDGWGKNRDGLERYWRYNALDGYYTLLGFIELLNRIVNLPWALRNYNAEFRLSVGPCLAASLRGIKVDYSRHQQIMLKQAALAEAGREDLKRLSGEADYNVNSSNDNAWLLYDVLGAKATRLQRKGTKLGPRSTDEKVLKLMKEQRGVLFIDNVIDRILAAKKPAAIISKYGVYRELCYTNGRFHSWHNAAGTETYRLNSGNWQYWTGTNGQNLQPFIQEMMIADPNYVIVDFDYSASDDWFIAYEAQDDVKINNLKTKDTHSFHAATFFKLNYDKVVAGKKAHEEWVVHPITGVRQIAKKFNHGKNFRMGAQMTYNLMGRDMAVATARLMGYKNPESMTDKELIGMCEVIGDMYDHPRTGMYKRIRPWQDQTVVELKANGGLATNAFGLTRKFFGSPNDHEVQRELSAYFGQSGTAGNTNRSVNEIFYSGIDDGRNCLFILQVHDSLKFLVHKNNLGVIPKIKAIMEKPLVLKDREFFVPVNVECGLTDGKRMVSWHPDITYKEIVDNEHKQYDAKFPKGKDALLAQLGNFGSAVDIVGLEAELHARFGDEDETSQTESDELEIVDGNL